MTDLLDRGNKHLFLEKMNNSNNSFIANVNLLVQNLDALLNLGELFTREDVEELVSLSGLDIDVLVKDIEKGSLDGYRKLDIDLLRNFADYSDTLTDEQKRALWSDPTKQVYYDGISVNFTDRMSMSKTFNQLGVPTPISNHHQLYTQLDEWPEFKAKAVYTMFNIAPNTPIPNHELFRLWDGEGTGSNVDRIVLHVAANGQNQAWDASFAGAKDYNPVYTWIDTTSILIILTQKINEVLASAGNVEKLLILEHYLKELTAIYSVLPMLASNDANVDNIYKHLSQLEAIYYNLDALLQLEDILPILENINNNKANIITKDVPSGYLTSYSIPQINNSLNYVIGDILTSVGDTTFTFRVTAVTDEGKITGGFLYPTSVPTDLTGNYGFANDSTVEGTELRLNITCTALPTTITVRKDLIDVYNELKAKAEQHASDISNLYENVDTLEVHLTKLEENIANIEIGDGEILSNFILKNSGNPQVVNSNLTFYTNKKLSGTKTDGTAHTLIQSARMSTASGSSTILRDIANVGSISEHLHLNTNNDPVYENRITVGTPDGIKSLVYKEDISDSVAINFLLGSCIPWAGNSIPDQTKLAVGNTYPVADFPEAAAELGDKYGGDGVTTFGTPDLRNEPPLSLRWIIVLGRDNGSSTRFYCGRDGLYCGKEGLYCGMQIVT